LWEREKIFNDGCLSVLQALNRQTKITFSKRTLYTIVILLHLRRDNKLLELYLEHNPRQKKEEAIPL